MARMMSACGVWCSGCPAFHAEAKGLDHQKRAVAAWRRIYHLRVKVEDMDCGGCAGPDEQIFYMSRTCKARRCCLARGLASCAPCAVRPCAALEKAQSNWDTVPQLAAKLSREDFVAYAKAYCGHRRRLASARRGGSR